MKNKRRPSNFKNQPQPWYGPRPKRPAKEGAQNISQDSPFDIPQYAFAPHCTPDTQMQIWWWRQWRWGGGRMDGRKVLHMDQISIKTPNTVGFS